MVTMKPGFEMNLRAQTIPKFLTCAKGYNAANDHSDKDSTCSKECIRYIIYCVPSWSETKVIISITIFAYTYHIHELF